MQNLLNCMEEFSVISSKTRQAAEACLSRNVPFAIVAEGIYPYARFFASIPDEAGCNEAHIDNPEWEGFFINFFGNDEPYLAGVANRMNEDEAIEYCKSLPEPLPGPELTLQPETQSRLEYMAAVSAIILGLKKRGGKVVYSRLLATSSPHDILDVAETYFRLLPDTFRYVCFTQETGLWFGASPELLLEVDTSNAKFETMSLAGTRLTGSDAKWDVKNSEEQFIVTAFIKECLEEMGALVAIGKRSTRSFGNIEHLMTPVYGKLAKPANLMKTLRTLSPTPAVAGFPRAGAVPEIIASETHSRFCYAGFVGVKQAGKLTANVNLRCAMAAPNSDGPGYSYNLFVGGGITHRSVPAKEWEETENKARILREAIANPNEARKEIDG